MQLSYIDDPKTCPPFIGRCSSSTFHVVCEATGPHCFLKCAKLRIIGSLTCNSLSVKNVSYQCVLMFIMMISVYIEFCKCLDLTQSVQGTSVWTYTWSLPFTKMHLTQVVKVLVFTILITIHNPKFDMGKLKSILWHLDKRIQKNDAEIQLFQVISIIIAWGLIVIVCDLKNNA